MGKQILRLGGGIIAFFVAGVIILYVVGIVAGFLLPIATSIFFFAVFGLAAVAVVYFLAQWLFGKDLERPRPTGCLILAGLQGIVLLVWGVFFFALGMSVDVESIPPEFTNVITAINDLVRYLVG